MIPYPWLNDIITIVNYNQDDLLIVITTRHRKLARLNGAYYDSCTGDHNSSVVPSLSYHWIIGKWIAMHCYVHLSLSS